MFDYDTKSKEEHGDTINETIKLWRMSSFDREFEHGLDDKIKKGHRS